MSATEQLDAAGEVLSPAVRAVILALEARVVALEAEVHDLRARLALDSTNSSQPPSADPPGTVRPGKPKSGRKRGAQPGHRGHFRHLLPVGQVDHVVEHRPLCCRRCGHSLADARSVGKPVRHQITELPSVHAEVTEHRSVRLACPGCGARTRAALPAAVEGHCVGPRLAAWVAMLTGSLRLSRRQVQGLLRELLGPTAPSLGSVDARVAEASGALGAPYRQIRRAVRASPVAGVDETGWRLRATRRWMWAAVTERATLFRLAPHRSRAAFHRLLGRDYAGVLTTDRYGAYHQHPVERRQLCWAHLARDFAGLAVRAPPDSPAARLGQLGSAEVGRLFALWHRFPGRDPLAGRSDAAHVARIRSLRTSAGPGCGEHGPQGKGTLPQPECALAGALDLCLRGGGGAHQQCHRAGAAPRRALEKDLLRLGQRPRAPQHRTHSQRERNRTPAAAEPAGVPDTGHCRTPQRSTSSAPANPLNGYKWLTGPA